MKEVNFSQIFLILLKLLYIGGYFIDHVASLL